jgi:hypothetical protein
VLCPLFRLGNGDPDRLSFGMAFGEERVGDFNGFLAHYGERCFMEAG